MRLNSIVAALSITAVSAPAALADTTTYDCSMSSLEGRGFIRDRIIFSIDLEKNKAAVVDDLVMATYDAPIPAALSQLGNGHYRLKWDVKNLKSGAQSFNLSYTLQYRPETNAFNIRALVRGYDNRPFGSGTCKISTEKSLFG
ncbi:MAG: hypothetical protein AAF214_01195 [Pseudomonadota bacterium]